MGWHTDAYGEKAPDKCMNFDCCKECDFKSRCKNPCNGNCFNCSKKGRTKEERKNSCGTHDGGWDDM